MSVINKMLKDLDKREKGQDDGVYHPESHSGVGDPGRIAIVILGVFVVILMLASCVFGYLYYMSKDQRTDSSIASAINSPIVQNEEEKQAISVHSDESELLMKEEEDEEDITKLEDELYGPDEINIEKVTKKSETQNGYRQTSVEENIKQSVPVEKKVMKVTPVNLTKEQEIELDTKTANIALSQGQIDKAIEAYQGILAKDPKNRKAREKMASLFYGTGNYLQARNVLQQGIAADPSYPDYRLLLARIMIEQGNKKEALSVLTSLSLKSEPGNVDYLSTEASLATEFNEPEIAIDAYSKLTKIMPNEGKWWFGLGVAFDRKGMKPAALNNYKRAVGAGLAEASHRFALQRIQELEK